MRNTLHPITVDDGMGTRRNTASKHLHRICRVLRHGVICLQVSNGVVAQATSSAREAPGVHPSAGQVVCYSDFSIRPGPRRVILAYTLSAPSCLDPWDAHKTHAPGRGVHPWKHSPAG